MFYIPIIVSLFAVAFVIFLIQQIKRASSGSDKTVQISQAIKEGVVSYLKRQYKTIGVAILILFVILWIALGFKFAFAFLIGALASALVGFVGMMVSTTANLKVVEAAKNSLKESFKLSFYGGSVLGFLVPGFALLTISLFYLITNDLKSLVALCFGGSLISIFARIGGGIYTKAADVGADLVGKIEKDIPEDDPRNPAVIADQVGDNVGDCAGIAADLFETYAVSLTGAMILGSYFFVGKPEAIFLPLILSSFSLVASIIATFFVRLRDKDHDRKTIDNTLYRGLIISSIISALGFYPLTNKFASLIGIEPLNLYLLSLVGLVAAHLIFLITNYYTSKNHKPVQSIAQASTAGHATNIITGLAVGMKSVFLPVILFSLVLGVSVWLGGVYGLAISVCSFISLIAIVISMDASGPISDNASGIAEMANLDEETKKRTDLLDSAGKKIKAEAKGYTAIAGGLSALVLFLAFTQDILNFGCDAKFLLDDYKVLIGLFVGGLLPYLFGSMLMESVGRAASKIVEEARRQFREIKGLIEGTESPKYGLCVDIVTKASIKEMIIPAIIPILAPIVIGLVLGIQALTGLLIGAIVSGVFVAISMTSGGAAWNSAKKYIEEGNLGGKESFAHEAAVTGDTVGDPYMDTAGPAINSVIKVLNIVALLIASFII